MSKRTRSNNGTRKAGASKEASRSDVGYGRPPKEHQFRPGKSGNERGRPRGAKNTSTILHEILGRKIDVNIAGSTRRMTLREAILMRFAQDALKGNPKSAAFIFQREAATNASAEQDDAPLHADEQAIIDAYLQPLLKGGSVK
jgi:hypothetical protein